MARAQVPATDSGFPFMAGKVAPLTLRLKELDSNWRVFSTSTNSYENLIAMAMGGGSPNHIYTKGETVTIGTDTFLIAYKPEATVDMTSLMAGGGKPPKTKPLTEASVLKLSLLNLHALTSMDSIQVFNLKEEVGGNKGATMPMEIISSDVSTTRAAPAERALLPNGSVAPDFVVKDRAGNPVKLSAFRGKVVVLDFWATWCGPCQESLPNTNAIAAKYASKGVVVLGVNVWDSQAEFNKWLPDHKKFSAIKFAIDTKSQGQDVATKLYNVSGIPTQYIIDRKGKIVKSLVGYSEDESTLTSAIYSALVRK